MNNNKIIAAIQIEADDLDLQNDIDRLQAIHQHNDSAKRMVHSLVSSKGGRPIGSVQGHEIVEIPLESIDILKEINKRLKSEMGLDASIGVGEDSREAIVALKYAGDNDPGSIKVYDVSLEKPEEPHQELSVATAPDDHLYKAEPPPAPVSEEQKVKIAQLIDDLKNNREAFEAMRQQAPEAYDGVVSLVQSIKFILDSEKQEQEKQVIKMIEKINQHLEKQHDKMIEKQGKEIEKQANKEHKILSRLEEETLRKLADISKRNNADRRKKAFEHGQKHGHSNPIFFHHLINEFRRK